jgi:hypothetical protein
MSGVLNLLIEAIKTRRCAIIRYDGQQQIRVVEPHVIYTDDADNIVVECMQTRGQSDPDAAFPFWQPFYLKKINSVFLLNIAFEPRLQEGFRPDAESYKKGLLAMVAAPATSVVYRRRTEQTEEKPLNMLFYQARGWWWEMGDAIDRVLSDKDWPGGKH